MIQLSVPLVTKVGWVFVQKTGAGPQLHEHNGIAFEIFSNIFLKWTWIKQERKVFNYKSLLLWDEKELLLAIWLWFCVSPVSLNKSHSALRVIMFRDPATSIRCPLWTLSCLLQQMTNKQDRVGYGIFRNISEWNSILF